MRILLITGSTRSASTNTAALRTIQALGVDGVETAFFDNLAVLPPFNPDNDTDPLPATVADLRARIATADAVLFCTPEYAGSLPGTLKNLLDWTVKGGELYEKPVASLSVGAPGRGEAAQQTLGTVLGYVGAEFLADAWRRVTVPREAVGAGGLIADTDIRAQLAALIADIRDIVAGR